MPYNTSKHFLITFNDLQLEIEEHKAALCEIEKLSQAVSSCAVGDGLFCMPE